jgi:hypothetical protein
MAQPQTLTGYAVGGPRDRVKLTASPRWDGLVIQKKTQGQRILYYSGYYIWSIETSKWVWMKNKR